jgi:Family of unknown function (DUF6334)
MNVLDDVRALLERAGPLVRVDLDGAELHAITAVDLCFAEGTLQLRPSDDLDEILVTVGDSQPTRSEMFGPANQLALSRLQALVGMHCEYVWCLTNHRGYVDGAQIRMLDLDSRREATWQFEVMASTLMMWELTQLRAV